MKNHNLALIEQVLKEGNIDSNLYSIGEYAEESVCVFYNGEQYEVFVCERDNKYDCRRYYSAKEAGIDVVKRLMKKGPERDALLEKIRNLVR